MTDQKKRNIKIFLACLLAKMERGEKEHGESKGNEIKEIEDELIDIVGWAFVRWERLQKFKASK